MTDAPEGPQNEVAGVVPQELLRPSIEKSLGERRWAPVWQAVEAAFPGDLDEQRDYWDFLLGLRDSWRNMSRAPSGVIEGNVAEIASMAQALANKIAANTPELRTLLGYADFDIHTMFEADLRHFAAQLRSPSNETSAMRFRPRGMERATAERTYVARALTGFLCSGDGRPRARLVAESVNALLDLHPEDGFDEKQVRDITEDICRHSRKNR